MQFSRVELQPTAAYRDPHAPVWLVLTRASDVRAAYGDSRFLPVPDLERCFLVAAHRGPCPTGGYAVRISGIEQDGAEVTVTLNQRDPRPGETVTMMITHPRDCVAVEKSELASRGKLLFHFVDDRGTKLGQANAHID